MTHCMLERAETLSKLLELNSMFYGLNLLWEVTFPQHAYLEMALS